MKGSNGTLDKIGTTAASGVRGAARGLVKAGGSIRIAPAG